MTPAPRPRETAADGRPPRPGSRNDFGATWWGRAWIDALEKRAQLDPNRLPRGRTYARHGRVGPIKVTSGQISARVQGSRPQPYAVSIDVRRFSAEEWQRMLAAIAGKALHAAALLDGELVPEILADGRAAGVDLLPGPGELVPDCSCPDWADPCKHAAAVCYLVARTLDADPFELLHLRGRTRDEVLAGVRDLRRRTAAPADPDDPDDPEAGAGEPEEARRAAAGRPRARGTPGRVTPPGMLAREAWADGGCNPPAAALWALPAAALPRRPGHPTPLATDPPAGSPVSGDALRSLAQDAATRAWHLLRGDADGRGASGLALSAEQDLARRAAPLLGTSEFTRLARSSGIASHHLVELALAWRMGGAEGTDILTTEWEPDPETIADGRDALQAVVLRNVRVRVRANRITAGPVQLRVAPNGNWYRFEKVNNRWDLAAGPDVDPLNVAER